MTTYTITGLSITYDQEGDIFYEMRPIELEIVDFTRDQGISYWSDPDHDSELPPNVSFDYSEDQFFFVDGAETFHSFVDYDVRVFSMSWEYEGQSGSTVQMQLIDYGSGFDNLSSHFFVLAGDPLPEFQNVDDFIELVVGAEIGTTDDLTELGYGPGDPIVLSEILDVEVTENDTFSANDSNNTINSGAGDDIIEGNGGDDILNGGAGHDILSGADDNDTIRGQSGNDLLKGGAGADILNGGRGHDELRGGSDNDVLNGGRGRDILNGYNQDDILTGGAGADTFVFNHGHDTVTDFTNNVDTVVLDSVLWGGDLMTAGQILTTYASVQDGDLVFDFGDGNSLTLEGITQPLQLLNDLDII